MTQPLAVITGASRGIGLELAHQFAAHGFELLLAADEPVPMVAESVRVDLATAAGVEALVDRTDGREVDALALNAGITARSDDLERELTLIDLNVRSTVHLARLVTADMAARGHGRVLLTGSIVDVMPGPYQAAYNASKAFVTNFGLALRDELREHGVSVTVLEPGVTDTSIFAHAGQRNTLLASLMPKDDPEAVARQAFDALMDGQAKVVTTSLASKAAHMAGQVLPDTITARLNALVTKPRD
jgi:short-subunit dehydrogenase